MITDEKLWTNLKQLEQKRLTLRNKGAKIGITLTAIAGFIGLSIGVSVGFGSFMAILFLILAIIATPICINYQARHLKAFYKKDVIGYMIGLVCKDAVFTPEDGISAEMFNNSQLFRSPDRYSSEDLIKGCIDKTSFICAEVHAEEKRVTRNSKGQTTTTWVDIFKGFFFVADFNKEFKGRTILHRDSLLKLNWNGSRVKLENPEFEKKFDVYSTDQVEARYLLSLSLMDRLINLDKRFSSNITVSFYKSTVIIAVPDSMDHFEASIWRSMLNKEHIEKEFSTISSLIQIVEDLNLNTRIWTKE